MLSEKRPTQANFVKLLLHSTKHKLNEKSTQRAGSGGGGAWGVLGGPEPSLGFEP